MTGVRVSGKDWRLCFWVQLAL